MWGAFGSVLIAGGVILVNLRPRKAAAGATSSKAQAGDSNGEAIDGRENGTDSAGAGEGQGGDVGTVELTIQGSGGCNGHHASHDDALESERARLLGPTHNSGSSNGHSHMDTAGSADAGSWGKSEGSSNRHELPSTGTRQAAADECYDEEAPLLHEGKREQAAGGLFARMMGHMDSRIAVHHPRSTLPENMSSSSLVQRLNSVREDEEADGTPTGRAGSSGPQEGAVHQAALGCEHLTEARPVHVSEEWKEEEKAACRALIGRGEGHAVSSSVPDRPAELVTPVPSGTAAGHGAQLVAGQMVDSWHVVGDAEGSMKHRTPSPAFSPTSPAAGNEVAGAPAAGSQGHSMYACMGDQATQDREAISVTVNDVRGDGLARHTHVE